MIVNGIWYVENSDGFQLRMRRMADAPNTYSRINSPPKVVDQSTESGNNSDGKAISGDWKINDVFCETSNVIDLRNNDLVGTPRMVRASPNNSQDDSGSTSNDQNVANQIHLLNPGAQVVLGSLDVQEGPDETESEQAERKVDEEQPLPLFREGATDERSDGASECPNATYDPGKDASLG